MGASHCPLQGSCNPTRANFAATHPVWSAEKVTGPKLEHRPSMGELRTHRRTTLLAKLDEKCIGRVPMRVVEGTP